MFQVHEYTVDRAKGTARVGSTNPARTYVRGVVDDDGNKDVQIITVQSKGGETHYFDQGGQGLEKSSVPDYILADLRKNPLRRGAETPEQVLQFCEYCPAPDNAIASAAYPAHLVKHLVSAGVQTAKATTQAAAAVIDPEAVKAKSRKKAA